MSALAVDRLYPASALERFNSEPKVVEFPIGETQYTIDILAEWEMLFAHVFIENFTAGNMDVRTSLNAPIQRIPPQTAGTVRGWGHWIRVNTTEPLSGRMTFTAVRWQDALRPQVAPDG